MGHNRRLVLGAVSLTKARPNRHDIEVMGQLRDELEEILISSGYLDNAPFKWIGLVLRYGLKNEERPHYQRINKKYGDLPLAIELDTHDLLEADRDELKRLFMLATLRALIHAGKKYKLPVEVLEKRYNELGKEPGVRSQQSTG